MWNILVKPRNLIKIVKSYDYLIYTSPCKKLDKLQVKSEIFMSGINEIFTVLDLLYQTSGHIEKFTKEDLTILVFGCRSGTAVSASDGSLCFLSVACVSEPDFNDKTHRTL